jgi:uncharacterized protein YndB with AHSA1/START domain
MTEPVDVRASRTMTAPAPAIWAVLQDLNRLPQWLEFCREINDVSSPTAAPGVKYSVKPPGRMEPTTHWTIEAVDPGRRQVHRSEMPMLAGVSSTLEVAEGADGKATVSVHWHGEPRNLMGRLMRNMFQKRIDRNWNRSLEALDRVAAAG